jgi:transcriptional regulator with XRE-family HTH domain
MPKAVSATNKFKPLPKWEAEICKRVAARRRYRGLSQSKIAKKIGQTRDQLGNIEIARVPLRFWPGWNLCRELNLNPLWLLLGINLPEEPFIEIDIAPYIPQISEGDLFSDVCKRVLYNPIKNALRDAGLITRSQSFVILRKEWIAAQTQRAKELRSQAAALLKNAEEIESAIAESEDFHKKHPDS